MKTEELKELVQKAQSGDTRAFTELVHAYDRQVLNLAYRMVGNSMDAEDIYQEVFMRVYHQLPGFRFESEFYTWLYRIVINCSLSYRKNRNRNLHTPLDGTTEEDAGLQRTLRDTDETPETSTIQREIQENVEKSLDTLPTMQRAVFILRFLEDFKIRDIAEIIGCSEGAVKNYLFRSTRRMRKNLSRYIKS